MKKRMICWLMCGAVLVACAGCDNTPDEPTGGEVTTVTTVTTTVATTTADSTTPTSTEPTAAPTTTAAPTEKPQIGGPTFTIDGKTFEMGTSPDALLAHLGEPNEVTFTTTESRVDDCTVVQRWYDHMIVETYCEKPREEVDEKNTDGHILWRVYFTDDHYSFNGVSVGDTAEKLDRTPTLMEPDISYIGGGYMVGGVNYRYYYSRIQEDGHVLWTLFMDDETDEYWMEHSQLRPGATIETIIIGYNVLY